MTRLCQKNGSNYYKTRLLVQRSITDIRGCMYNSVAGAIIEQKIKQTNKKTKFKSAY